MSGNARYSDPKNSLQGEYDEEIAANPPSHRLDEAKPPRRTDRDRHRGPARRLPEPQSHEAKDEQVTETPNIYAALSAAMEEVQAVGKDGRNTQQGYDFRGVDQVVNAVGPIFRKHRIIPVPHHCVAQYRDVRTSNDKPSREVTVSATYRFYGPAGDYIEALVPGESMDSGDKGTPKAMSVAYRIALLQLLCIPTNDPDPDQDSYERAVDPIVEARVAVKQAWEANRGVFEASIVEKDYSDWAQGELLTNATADRLYQYADHLKQEAGA